MRNGLKLWILLATIGACGDDGSGSDSTSEGTDTTGTGGPTTTSPSTSTTTEDTSTGTAEGSGSTDGSTTDIGSESGSGGSESGSAGSTGSTGSGSDSTGGNETASVCTPIDFTPVVGAAFNGSAGCEGVMTNAVLDDATAVGDHHDAYCETLQACIFPAPECPPEPAVEIEGNRVVYVFGQTSGCSASATISEVLDCGDEVEVHWVLAGIGICATVVNGWDAALIPDGADVAFIQD